MYCPDCNEEKNTQIVGDKEVCEECYHVFTTKEAFEKNTSKKGKK